MSLQWIMKSKIGSLYLVASEKALEGLYLNKQEIPLARSLEVSGSEIKILSRAVKQLEEYFSGKRKNFNLPLEFKKGTPFQKQVWNQLLKIPYGTTVSYQDVAKKIKNPLAVRAVGSANGKNPLCIIVPCHRVIAANRSLGGYSGGLNIKTRLLELESR